MDSISQIVLGAAVGEVVLGKKIGNKAMIWGAIGGTIPDLDVLASPILTELQALAFHRGITHSIFFSVFGGLFFGWAVNKLYSRKKEESPIKEVGFKMWSWFFFWTFLTHALLDCFTMYGTQLFAPFSDYRVAFSTVAVADFFYTLPFIFCLIMASRKVKNSSLRSRWNWLGIGWSCLYLMFTAVNKQYVSSVYKSQLADKKVAYERIIVGPTILTNFLWSATVDIGDQFYIGQYSLFDTSPVRFLPVDKNHSLLKKDIHGDKTLKTLGWFTNDFVNVMRRTDGKLQMNDLRFGTFSNSVNDENDFIFRFPIKLNTAGDYELLKVGKGPAEGNRKDMMGAIFDRIKGK